MNNKSAKKLAAAIEKLATAIERTAQANGGLVSPASLRTVGVTVVGGAGGGGGGGGGGSTRT